MKQRRWQAEIEITVPFYDVDSLDVVWHGNSAKYFELARCALLESIDYDYVKMGQSGYAWPVVELFVRYPRALRFNQKISVLAYIHEYECRLKINYIIRDVATGVILTRGHTVQVAVNITDGEMLYELPEIFYNKLGIPAP